MSSPGTEEIELDLEDVRAELSERGRVEFELAQLRATNRKLAARLRDEVALRLKAEAAE